jgi:16S rRNA (guanine966-N2)-methyltransferase
MRGGPPGSVRIVAGTKRGRRLRVPHGPEIRPTSEMVREAVFDVLGPVTDLRVLDLFAGTGALGLEALSRGAGGCVFVEHDPAVAAVLRENIATLGYGAASLVLAAEYRTAVSSLARDGALFDLLFVDPPYKILSEVEVTLTPLLTSLLSAEGLVVIEGRKSAQVTFGRTPLFERDYGETKIIMVNARSALR